MDISLSPSGASRWLKCTASPAFIAANKDRLPKDSSDASREGTVAHNVAAAGLMVGREVVPDLAENKEMEVHVMDYIEFVESKKRKGDTHIIEAGVPVWYNPKKKGFIDSALFSPKRLYVADLKYGQGIPVPARGNSQLAIYGRSLIEDLIKKGHKFHRNYLITLAIFQPRGRGEVISIWTLTWKELQVFTENIETTAEGIKAGEENKFAPSDDACRFCRAQPICTERAKWLLRETAEDILPTPDKPLEAVYLDDPARLSPSTLSFLMQNKSAIVSWLEKIVKYGQAAIHSGKPELVNDEWKIVDGKLKDRVWRDRDAAVDTLTNFFSEEELFPEPELLSPSKVEGLLKTELKMKPKEAKELLAQLVKRDAGNPAVAHVDDPRPEANPKDAFLDLSLL